MFEPTHILIRDSQEIPVCEIKGEDEFFTEADYQDWFPEQCELGSYAIDDNAKQQVLELYSYEDEEFGKIVAWRPIENVSFKAICTQCSSTDTVRNGTNGYTQRYKCRKCGATFVAGCSISKTSNFVKLSKSLVIRDSVLIATYKNDENIKRVAKSLLFIATQIGNDFLMKVPIHQQESVLSILQDIYHSEMLDCSVDLIHQRIINEMKMKGVEIDSICILGTYTVSELIALCEFAKLFNLG